MHKYITLTATVAVHSTWALYDDVVKNTSINQSVNQSIH